MLHDLYFTTATVKQWKHLFKPDKYKDWIAGSLDYSAREGTCWIYAFVIMPNHFISPYFQHLHPTFAAAPFLFYDVHLSYSFRC